MDTTAPSPSPDSSNWFDSYTQKLRALPGDSFTLWILMLALGSFAAGYAGMTHDARLYSAQTLRQLEPEVFDRDLFFQYGSQDNYTLFSKLTAPLVRIFGIQPVFFTLFLLFRMAFCWGALRLFQNLELGPDFTKLSALTLGASTLYYGGLNVFQVQENYLTPRILAEACTMAALANLLAGRWLSTFLLLVLGLVIHPLMAFPGCLVVACFLTIWILPKALSIALFALGFLTLGVLWLTPSLGWRFFGQMDGQWLEMSQAIAPYNFPRYWMDNDLWRFMPPVGICLGALIVPDWKPRTRVFLGSVVLTALVGFLATLVGSEGGLALLIQGQPYRALWLLRVLQIPLGFVLARHLFGRPEAIKQWLGVLVLLAIVVETGFWGEWLIYPFAILVAIIPTRGLESQAKRPDWIMRAGATGVGVGMLLWSVGKLLLFVNYIAPDYVLDVGPQVYVLGLRGSCCPGAWVLLLLLVTGIWPGIPRHWMALCIVAVGMHASSLIPWPYESRDAVYEENATHLAEYLKTRPEGQRRPITYSDVNIFFLWNVPKIPAYFDFSQLIGVIFHPETAKEGQRRAHLAAPFMLHQGLPIKKISPFAEYTPNFAEVVFGRPFEKVQATAADLGRLCQDPVVELVAIKQHFPGLEFGKAGPLYLYDPKEVCEKLNLPRK